jgi:hypothetical protein
MFFNGYLVDFCRFSAVAPLIMELFGKITADGPISGYKI